MSYYSSNQKKQAAYLTLRKNEDVNSNIQQNKLYQKLALERGEIEQATNLAKLASSVFNKVTKFKFMVISLTTFLTSL